MELPRALRHAVDRALDGMALSEIAAAAADLSRRYREELRDGKLHVATERAVLAYLAVRLPATYAAVRASFAAVAAIRPDFAPATILDAGAGPGTALWAAADCWPDLKDAFLVEASQAFRNYGERLTAETGAQSVVWRAADIAADDVDCAPRDLVTLAYVLNEITANGRPRLLDRLWQLTADMLVIVEPGTPAGWQRILAAREHLLADGAHLVAPCPHAHACPLEPPDWCHFAKRVARSRIHRLAKGADVPWEDEKFIYLAVSRKSGVPQGAQATARIIAPPRKGSGRVTLKLCRPDGTAADQLFSRRDGAAFKEASRADWGDTLRE
jgi:ribosomal protein RSM22 (predicted rRNA methylase)